MGRIIALTSLLVECAHDLLNDYHNLPHDAELSITRRLQEWANSTRYESLLSTRQRRQDVLDLAVRHLVTSAKTWIDLVPKHRIPV